MGSVFWVVVAGVFLILELIIPGLFTVWFGLAGILMVFLSPFIKDASIEFYVFSIVSVFLLLLTRPFVKKYLYKNDGDNISFKSRIIGRETKIVRKLEEDTYEVILDYKEWRAVSDENFELGEKAIITGITGNKLVLKKKIN